MAQTYHELVIQILEKCLEEGMQPDAYFMNEDLAHNRGMLFAPELWRTYIKPSVARLGAFLDRHGIDFWLHSDATWTPLSKI